MHSIFKRPVDRKIALDATVLADCQRWIDHRLGLHFPPQNWHDLSRHLDLLAGELGYKGARHLALELLSQPRNSGLEHRLADALTVSETYFYRDPPCFEHLKYHVLRPLIARRKAAGARHLSLWSAGCSTGEEAYSLAMLVDGLLDDPDSWQIDIFGSDLSHQSLTKAREGLYGAWSFRSAASNLTSGYFQPEPAGEVAGRPIRTRFWRVRRKIKDRVRFFQLNLATAVYPDEARGLANIDVIMCRNVLMYLSPAQAISVLGRLAQCLCDDGILLVGAVDGGLCQSAGLNTAVWPGALAISAEAAGRSVVSLPNEPDVQSIEKPFAEASTADGPAASNGGHLPLPEQPAAVGEPSYNRRVETTYSGVRPGSPVASNLWQRANQALAQGRYPEAWSLAERYVGQSGLTLGQEAEGANLCARILANLKQLEEAEYWARQAIQLDGLQASGYWVLATILLERNQPEGARCELVKALYLRPDFVLAHYLSGLISSRLQEHSRARRELRNCLELLSNLESGEPVMEGEGVSVSELNQLATIALAELENEGVDKRQGTAI